MATFCPKKINSKTLNKTVHCPLVHILNGCSYFKIIIAISRLDLDTSIPLGSKNTITLHGLKNISKIHPTGYSWPSRIKNSFSNPPSHNSFVLVHAWLHPFAKPAKKKKQTETNTKNAINKFTCLTIIFFSLIFAIYISVFCAFASWYFSVLVSLSVSMSLLALCPTDNSSRDFSFFFCVCVCYILNKTFAEKYYLVLYFKSSLLFYVVFLFCFPFHPALRSISSVHFALCV